MAEVLLLADWGIWETASRGVAQDAHGPHASCAEEVGQLGCVDAVGVDEAALGDLVEAPGEPAAAYPLGRDHPDGDLLTAAPQQPSDGPEAARHEIWSDSSLAHLEPEQHEQTMSRRWGRSGYELARPRQPLIARLRTLILAPERTPGPSGANPARAPYVSRSYTAALTRVVGRGELPGPSPRMLPRRSPGG